MVSRNKYEKHLWRTRLREVLETLSSKRKDEASEALITELLPTLRSYSAVASFCSFFYEVNTSRLNRLLLRATTLAIPRVDGGDMTLHAVRDLERDLEIAPFGCFQAKASCPILEEEVGCILVPGVGFSADNHRLGHGYGFYDKLLSRCTSIETIGIGYSEQLVEHLPIEPHDVQLNRLFLR